MTTRIVIDGDDAYIYAPFSMKDVIKATPGRRWDKQNKCWIISSRWVPTLTLDLNWNGEEVTTGDDDDPPNKPHTPVPNPFAPMFIAVGATGHDMLHEALADVLNPYPYWTGMLNIAYSSVRGTGQ